MRCPFCGNIDTQVKDSRPAEDHVSIRRRRFCPACGGRFTTYERVQLRDLVVIKSSGKREDFDRSKLERSIRIAMQKRPIDPERIDQMISGIVRRLESLGDTDIPSKQIGEIVMETLARIDTVAYVRFASVYKNFQTADDFDGFVSELRPGAAGGRVTTKSSHGPRPAPCGAGPGQYLAQPGGGLRSGQGRPDGRSRLDPTRRPPPCRSAGPGTGRARRRRRHRLCHAGTLRPSRRTPRPAPTR